MSEHRHFLDDGSVLEGQPFQVMVPLLGEKFLKFLALASLRVGNQAGGGVLVQTVVSADVAQPRLMGLTGSLFHICPFAARAAFTMASTSAWRPFRLVMYVSGAVACPR